MTLLKLLNLWPPFEHPTVGTIYLVAQDAYVPGAIQQGAFVLGVHEQNASQAGSMVQDAV